MSTRVPGTSEPNSAGPHAVRSRSVALDRMRGIAVCLMVAWHLCDGWIAEAHRHGDGWSRLRVLGGMAAPLFLFVTGASAGLGTRDGRSVGRAVRRGLELLVLGFLLRMQSWAIDRGALFEPRHWLTLSLGMLAGVLALLSASAAAPLRWLRAIVRPLRAVEVRGNPTRCARARAYLRASPRGVAPSARSPGGRARVSAERGALAGGSERVGSARMRTALLALAAFAALALCARSLDPHLLALLLRVDVQHCIGVAGVVCALFARCALRAEHARREPRISTRAHAMGRRWVPTALLAAAAIAIIGATPLAQRVAGASDALAWIAGAASARPLAPFPVFPWCAYALAGCSVSLAPISRARLALALALVVAAISFEGGIPATRHVLHASPLLRPFARFAFHTSIALTLLQVATALRWRPFDEAARALGRSSLAIYWLHLELAYGVLSRPFARSLAPAPCALAVLAILAIACLGALARGRAPGGERAHTFARDVVSSPNLRA